MIIGLDRVTGLVLSVVFIYVNDTVQRLYIQGYVPVPPWIVFTCFLF